MYKLLKITVSVIVFTLVSQKASAQWDLFSDLLSQMNNNVYNQYFDNLGSLDTTWSINHVEGNDLLNEHYDLLDTPYPAGMLDSSYLWGLNAGIDTLEDHLPGFGLLDIDNDTLLGQAEHVQDLFEANFDSLGGLFGQYQDSLDFDSSNWNVTIIGFDELTEHNLNILQDTLGMVMDTTSPHPRPHDLGDLIGKMFDRQSFPDLELAFGMQEADLKYYNDIYSATAKVLRIGSVPRFDHDYNPMFSPGLPIEARWHVEVSFLNKKIPTSVADPILAPVENKGFNPLLFNGDFAMMATPGIGVWGNTTFRLITSLGIEFGTYAPAHRNYSPPFTSFNKGYATGAGPQLGGGFTMTTGPLVIYTLTTVAHGNVLRCPRPYKYDSQKLEVGIRYGNIINVRCSTGKTTWQPNDNRRAKVGTQVTVGIIL